MKKFNTNGLVKKADYNTKITRIKNKIPSALLDWLLLLLSIQKPHKLKTKQLIITNLATKTALNTKATEIKNKILILVILLILKNLID